MDRRRLARRPIQIAAAQNVQVQMEDGLPCPAVTVHHSTVTLVGKPGIARDPGRCQIQFAD